MVIFKIQKKNTKKTPLLHIICYQTVRGGRVAEMSAHSIQRCDWPIIANIISTETRNLKGCVTAPLEIH